MAAASSITVPMSTVGSMGSPYLTSRVLSTRRSTKRAATDSWTRMRFTAVQRWPEFLYAPDTAKDDASWRSASSITMRGSLPPSSSTARRYPIRAAMYLPTSTPPVKVISSASGLVMSSSAISRGSPVTTDSTAGGSPTS